MGIGIGRFLPWENGVQATQGLGFSHWEWEKNVKNQEWKWDLCIAKLDFKKQKAEKWDWYLPLRTL